MAGTVRFGGRVFRGDAADRIVGRAAEVLRSSTDRGARVSSRLALALAVTEECEREELERFTALAVEWVRATQWAGA